MKYLETFRRAVRESEAREIREVSEISPPSTPLSSLTSLNSPPERSVACAVCGETDDLWTLDTPTGTVAVHQECAEFLPKPETAEPTAAYQAASPDCVVTIVEIPATGLRYRRTFGVLQLRPPALIEVDRWRQCIKDARTFLRQWGSHAEALGWDSRSLFGLRLPPEKPHPSYRRLSRYDATGLVWLLEGRSVVALTADTATIKNAVTGTTTTYRRMNKPAPGPVGDSLDDLRERRQSVTARKQDLRPARRPARSATARCNIAARPIGQGPRSR